VRRNRVVFNDLSDDETVMLDVEHGVYFGVRGTGKRIWDQLSTATTIDALVAELIREYDVEEELCRRDVTGFVDELLQHGLVEVANVPTFS
jgi:hypothetical protein